MTWSELLFAHWALPAEVVQQYLPAGLELDTYAGRAWVGVVPFLMSDVAPRMCPPLPWLSRFLELNLRTYVRCQDKAGVWFFSLEAENPIAVRMARTFFYLPYMDAEMSHAKLPDHKDASSLSDEQRMIEYRSHRTHRGEPPAEFDAVYQPIGDSFHAATGSLEHWLTARYCLYSSDRRGQLYRGEIDHPPWTLRPARCELRVNTIGQPWKFDMSGSPHLLYAEPVKVRAWLAQRVR